MLSWEFSQSSKNGDQLLTTLKGWSRAMVAAGWQKDLIIVQTKLISPHELFLFLALNVMLCSLMAVELLPLYCAYACTVCIPLCRVSNYLMLLIQSALNIIV